MPLHLYAEHLLNIRTLSLQASLSTVSNKETRVTLSADGNQLSLSHEGETTTIQLPISVPGSHNAATLTIPASPTKDLTFRISLSEKSGSDLLTTSSGEDTNVVPWTAPSLTTDTQVSCRACGTVTVERGKIQVWKDLPSENWAEMMDFWHCHRPDVPRDNHNAAPKKGYAASSRLALDTGVAMVDPVDFVISAADCQNLSTVPSNNSMVNDQIHCSSCRTFIGHVYGADEGYKLRKLHLSLSVSTSSDSISYEKSKWLACHLLASVESQGVRKFTIRSVNAGEATLKIWIFTPDTIISSSASKSPKPIRVVKILWMDSVDSSSEAGALTRQALSEGELELPPDEMVWLREHFVQNGALLPEGARKFQSWNVALLPRFSEADIGHQESDEAAPVQLPEVPSLRNKDMLAELTA